MSWLNHIGQSLSSVGLSLAWVLIAILILEIGLWLIFRVLLKSKHSLLIMLLAPAAIGLFILILFPLVYELSLAFSNMSLRRFRNPEFGLDKAWDNLRLIFTAPVLKQTYFGPLFLRTMAWTLIQVFFHVSLGLCLALLLNRNIKARGFFRAILIFPWAMPQIVAILAWRNEFNYELGFVNILLRSLGVEGPPQWLTDPGWNFLALNLVNIWLGVPFMMVTLLGGLQAIDRTLYEAAEIDGAGPLRRFRSITLPLLQPILTPLVVLGVIWTFNNFNVPFLINQNILESSDILVTALFRAAFEYNRYGFAAMLAFVIFIILLGLTILYLRLVQPRRKLSS